jgi:hypothetical protein
VVEIFLTSPIGRDVDHTGGAKYAATLGEIEEEAREWLSDAIGLHRLGRMPFMTLHYDNRARDVRIEPCPLSDCTRADFNDGCAPLSRARMSA